jgi:hypothetical protein
MQDIDFDEIDRAVSSVTNNDTEVSTPPVSAPAPTTPVVETPTVSSETTPSPAARRSTGRFMDVVHPSSDMRPNSDAREKGPSAPSLHREDVVSARTETTERPAPAAVASTAFHWPDPIDLATPEPVAEVVSEPTPTPEVTVPEEILVPEEVASLESPFLTDAKVEKRPLGAFSDESHPELPLLEDFPAPSAHLEPEVEKTEDTAPAPVIETEPADVPPELNEDVLLLEAHSEDEETTPVPEAEDIPVGPTSITQQYKEQPSTTTQASGSIYDTEAYHQPLAHPAKKRSSSLVIIWIVGLIIVGGGIGAAIYFVVLPMLG